ncbi:MAG TPA: ABC transporter permease [Bryobacteraceae bacterium]|nr:ABC transporter permease [Bryobacteraceae bacterium]
MSRLLDIVRLRLRSLLRRNRVERELDRELQFHLERQTAENISRGMPPAEALRAALRSLGGFTQIEEECRDMRRTNLLENFLNDLRYTLRALGRSPGFTAIIVLTLALSIGANSAIFSVIDGVLLRRLPYPGQDRIVRIFTSSHEYPKFPINAFDFLDFRARNHSFACMAIMTHYDMQLSGHGQPVRLTGYQISAGYFRVLGLRPSRGREFTTRDELQGNQYSVILSDTAWRSRFAADPDVLGRKVILDNHPYTVVGVMPPGTAHPGNTYRAMPYGETVDFWAPFTFVGDPNQRGSHYIEGIGRLKNGVSASQAQAEMNGIMAQLAREHPNNDTGWHVLVIPLYQEIVGPSRRMLLVLLGAVGLVLLIACANAANLLLARATARQREIAVRSALGASQSRIVRQLLTESSVIALIGAAAGLLVALGGVKVLVHLLPAGFPRAHDIHVNAAVFGFTLLVALGTGFLFGLAPALQAARSDVQQGLREGTRGSGASRRHLRLRNSLVIGEVSLACVLLIAAGLMLRSFVNLLQTDPGFRPEHVLTASISLPSDYYKDPSSFVRFYLRLDRNLQTIPGAVAAGIGSDLPWTGYDDNVGGFDIEGRKPPPHDEFHTRYHLATADYFKAVGIPLLRGRFFDERDSAPKAPLVLIVNQAFARECWPGEDPIGKRINFFNDHPKDTDWTTVIGVVGDVKDTPQTAGAEPAAWWPPSQTPFGFAATPIAVRTNGDPAAVADAVRRAVHDVDPTLAVADIKLLDQIADASVATPRFALFLVGLFAALAIALAAIGTYGVISYSVSQRASEFGMRVALGATPGDVLRLVVGQALRLAVTGVAIGFVAALALARLLRTMLYEVSSADPLTFALVPLLALAVAVVACWLPARRATHADPAVALRAE